MAQQSMLAGLLAQSRAAAPTPAPVAEPTPVNPPVDAPLAGAPPAAPAATPSLTALLAGTQPAPMRPTGLLAQLAGDGYYTPEPAPPAPPLKVVATKSAPVVVESKSTAPATAAVSAPVEKPDAWAPPSPSVYELRVEIARDLLRAGVDPETVAALAIRIVNDLGK